MSTLYDRLITAPRPECIYHYTSQAGLLSIVTTGSIYATHVEYMNDSAEVHYALHLAAKRVDRRRTKVQPLKRLLALVLDGLTSRKTVSRFAASFSTNGDLLSQWR